MHDDFDDDNNQESKTVAEARDAPMISYFQDEDELPDVNSGRDFLRMTKEAGLEEEVIVEADKKKWRRLINKNRQDIDRINTSIKQIIRETNTELVCAVVRRQSFVVERRLVDKGCKSYLFLPKEVWRKFGLCYDERNYLYDCEEARQERLTDEVGADLVAIRFDDPHFINYARTYEDNINTLKDYFRKRNTLLENAEDVQVLVKRLPEAITTIFQLYYIKFIIDIEYAKSRGISDWGRIGQDYSGEDLASRTEDIEVYYKYPNWPTSRYERKADIYGYLDYLDTKEWEYRNMLRQTGEEDEWMLKKLLASDDDKDAQAQFLMFDRLIQDSEFREHYDAEQPN